jgi:hypothetical protein
MVCGVSFPSVGSLRTALALAALDEVQPNLIIFDEFQRYRTLLIDPPNPSQAKTPDRVTQALRGTGSLRDAALLLLSATPYRLYSSRHDDAAGMSHHQEFFELIRFLFGPDKATPRLIEPALREFGAQMLSLTPDFDQIVKLRDSIQDRLRPVMSRTERPAPEHPTGAKVNQNPKATVSGEDLGVFKHWVARLQSASVSKAQRRRLDLTAFAVPYWLSIPLPVQMMGRGYVAWRLADHSRRRDEPRLTRGQRNRLEAPKVWPHPQLRMIRELVPTERLALPWIAPSLPWWDLQGPWSNARAAGGKMLVFSRFKAVPPALASLLSFGMESEWAHRLRYHYQREGDAHPLQLTKDRPTLPALFFPAPTLIAHIDPRRERPNTLGEARLSLRRQVGELLHTYRVPVRKSGGARPLWKLLGALERTREVADPDDSLPTWKSLRIHWRRAAAEQEDIMNTVLEQWHRAAEPGLREVTQSEVAALAEFALAGPGVVLGRALYRFDPDCLVDGRFGDLLRASWNGLRAYFNNAWFHAALTRRGQRYTESIPEAVVSGNLESVLDEHLWISSQLDADAVARFPRDLWQVLALRAGRHRVFEPGNDDGFVLRCHAAMPFADARVESPATGGEERLRTDDLRRAFNTPFWPHVLTTTSLGQEGLDFHVWCRQLLHWDLCPSPLDLEQREGRIQRFGSFAVRTALANSFRTTVLAEADGRISPWSILMEHASKRYTNDDSGLRPWWVCDDEQIERFFIELPHSRRGQRFLELGRQRLLYRLALGQPHQEDFIESVSRLPDDGRHRLALNLSPGSADIG